MVPALIARLEAALADDAAAPAEALCQAVDLRGALGDARAVPLLLQGLARDDRCAGLALPAAAALRTLGPAALDGCLAASAMMTHAACQFVGPLTFQTFSRHPVMLDEEAFRSTDPRMKHIWMAETGELVLVAPATADMSLSRFCYCLMAIAERLQAPLAVLAFNTRPEYTADAAARQLKAA